MLYNLVDRDQNFGETFCLNLQKGIWRRGRLKDGK
jgi:hypothetical protein